MVAIFVFFALLMSTSYAIRHVYGKALQQWEIDAGHSSIESFTINCTHTYKSEKTSYSSSGYQSMDEALADAPIFCYAVEKNRKSVKKKW